MNTSSDEQSSGGRGPGQPTTQEIPVVPPTAARPPTGGAHPPPPGATPAPPQVPLPVHPTGPVDLVPGLPGAGVLPPPPPVPVPPPTPSPATEPGAEAPPTAPVTTAAESPAWPHSLEPDPAPSTARRPWTRQPADRRALTGLGLAVLAVTLLEVGLLLKFGSESLWSTVSLWSAFATLSALLALLAFAASYPAGNRVRPAAMWRIAAAGLIGLSVFWMLVVLPVVASDRGFVLTAALGCLGAALWVEPRRRTD